MKTKKKANFTGLISIAIMAIFLISLGIGFASPLLEKRAKDNKTKEQKEYIQKLIEAQNKAESEKTYDQSFKVDGDVTELKIIDIVTGTGTEAKPGSTVKVKYKGALASDGAVFGEDQGGAEFALKQGELIAGWVEGIPGMKVGGKRKLIVPSDKAYGPNGNGSDVPANADLVFEVELLEVK